MQLGEDGHGKDFLVLVDRLTDPNDPLTRARTSLWNTVLPAGSYEEISIADEKRACRPVRINAARRMVIVNWDAANGDYVCGSDETFLYFLTRQDRRDALLSGGGIILSEYQSGRGQPYQAAYDAIFGAGELEVVGAEIPAEIAEGEAPAESRWNGRTVHAFEKYRSYHPVIAGLSPSLSSNYVYAGPLFNFDKTRPQETFYSYKYRGSFYNGWFTSWAEGWVPLLVADLRVPRTRGLKALSPPPVVLLAKCKLGGVMLASTMRIAGARCDDLCKRLISINVDEVAKSHKRIRTNRVVTDLLIGAGVTLAVVLFSNYFPSLRGSILSDLGIFWTSIIGLRLWLHLVWRRPYGVSVLQFAKRGLQNFWETI